MALTVIFNTALMVIEADTDATCENDSGCTPEWLGIVNKLLLTIYTLDLAATMYVERHDFIWLWWNWLDVVIVVSGIAELLAYLIDPTSRSEVTLLRMLRLFRILRMLRMVRVLKAIPELYKLVTGFAYTMRAMVCGFWILISLVFLWAIVTVEIIGPLSRSIPKSQEDEGWCGFAFTSVWHAMLYFFQTLIAGDSWGACALPLARKYQGSFVLFVAVLVTVQLGFMNLLLSVIVDGAAEARGENDRIAS
jgi:voltage-gated sodium channel